MTDLETAAISTIEYNGRRYGITMRKLANIQMQMPIAEEDRPFVGMEDVLKFCSSPKGMCALLDEANESDNGFDPTNQPWSDMSAIVTLLINKMFGVPEKINNNEEISDPLAVATEIGS